MTAPLYHSIMAERRPIDAVTVISAVAIDRMTWPRAMRRPTMRADIAAALHAEIKHAMNDSWRIMMKHGVDYVTEPKDRGTAAMAYRLPREDLAGRLLLILETAVAHARDIRGTIATLKEQRGLCRRHANNPKVFLYWERAVADNAARIISSLQKRRTAWRLFLEGRQHYVAITRRDR